MCPSCAITSSERELFRAKVARDINLLESLRAKLALAIGDIECNLAYNEIKVARPDALDEPWSNDMSGPYKHIVFDNKAFVLALVEVTNQQDAFALARYCPPINVGENIKLYLNDVWQLDSLHVCGFDMATIRDPVTGRDPPGSLYYSLIQSVDEFILKKKKPGGNGSEADGHLGTGDVVVEGKGDEADGKEGAKEQVIEGVGQHGGCEGKHGDHDGLNQMSVEAENHGHEGSVMGLMGEGVQELSLSNASTSGHV